MAPFEHRQPQVWLWDAAAGRDRQAATLEVSRDIQISTVSASPDGSNLLCGTTSRSILHLMMIENFR
jgi:hypothetical protein